MKKVLAAVLAAAMSLSMASVAFAATTVEGTAVGSSDPTSGKKYATISSYANGKEYDVKDKDGDVVKLYNYGKVETKVYFDLGTGDNAVKFSKVNVHVTDGKVSAKKVKVDENVMAVVITPKYGKKDYKSEDWKVDIETPDLTFTLKGKGAYSSVQDVYSGAKGLKVSEAGAKTPIGKDSGAKVGCFFNFEDILDDEVRIRCDEYVDMYLKGNYDTRIENLEVSRTVPDGIEEYFGDDDVDCYDFVGTPKFAKDVTLIIDADSDTTIYEYDKSSNELTKLDLDYTKSSDYDSNGWKIKTKTPGCYIIAEEEYPDGNVKDEPVKEPVSEPTETTDKSNPGTGANDMVGAAAALAVVSLVAAGAVAFKKASK